MAAAKKPNIPADKLALYDKLIARHPGIERKGAANPYTSLNGHMVLAGWGFYHSLGGRPLWVAEPE